MDAIVNKIDGTGGDVHYKRTVHAVLHGCALKCRYCRSPEKRTPCLQCGICIRHCPGGALSFMNHEMRYDETRCINCSRCTAVCPFGSSPRTVRMSPEEVIARIFQEYPSADTIMVSGGECAGNVLFVQELFRMAHREGLTTAVGSNGTVPYRCFPELVSCTDWFAMNITAFDRMDHVRITGTGNAELLRNTAFLAERGKLVEVKSVIVPELYDTESSISKLGIFLKPFLKIRPFRICVIPYRPPESRSGSSMFSVPSGSYLLYLSEILKQAGFTDTVIRQSSW